MIVGESLLYFFVPTAESPKQITMDYAPITYLQTAPGPRTLLDFAVLYPNWGTYFGINELSDIDLPFPKAFKNCIGGPARPRSHARQPVRREGAA